MIASTCLSAALAIQARQLQYAPRVTLHNIFKVCTVFRELIQDFKGKSKFHKVGYEGFYCNTCLAISIIKPSVTGGLQESETAKAKQIISFII